MFKFINNLAIVEFNKDLGFIRVTFIDAGSVQQYLETIRIAISFAKLHHISSFLIIKKAYQNINTGELDRMLGDWLALLEQNLSRDNIDTVRLALLVNSASFSELSEAVARRQFSEKYAHLLFDLFFTDQQAIGFLESTPVNITCQGV